MDVLAGMRAFRAVASSGSFAAAGRARSTTTAWTSKQVSQLEAHLGAQLLVRTTRKLSLTDAGRIYLEHCARILDELDEAERHVGRLQASPRGVLRVTAPMSFGLARLAPLLPAFQARYPKVELDVTFDDRFVDVVEEGVDVAVRVGARLADSSLVARRLAAGERVVCAAPSYLRARGTPRHPRDLAQHACLRYSLHEAPSRWELTGPGGAVAVTVRGPIQVNNSLALCAAALAGSGVLMTPSFVVADALAQKKLRKILPDWRPSAWAAWAVSPPARIVAPKARAFVDFLASQLA